jgi:hypothetical protein
MVPTMRRFLFACLGLMAAASQAATDPRPATPEEIALFKQAMANSAQDTEHWAYTETRILRDKKGKVRDELVVRFDPSRPYEEQYTPIRIDGKEPSEKQKKKYRKQGEDRKRKREKRAAAAKSEGPQFHLDDAKAKLGIDQPLVVADEAGRITFEVPLISEEKDIPVEKFEILVHVRKEKPLVERAVFRLRESFRLTLVAKIRSGEASVDFTEIDPQFAPVVTNISGNFGVSLLFIPFDGTVTNTRADLKRVKAFDERFSVRLGPLEMLDF